MGMNKGYKPKGEKMVMSPPGGTIGLGRRKTDITTTRKPKKQYRIDTGSSPPAVYINADSAKVSDRGILTFIYDSNIIAAYNINNWRSVREVENKPEDLEVQLVGVGS